MPEATLRSMQPVGAPGTQFVWRWISGSAWTDAEYSVDSDTDQGVAIIRYPGFVHPKKRFRSGHAAISTSSGDFYTKGHAANLFRFELYDAGSGEKVGGCRYRYGTKRKLEEGTLSIGADQTFDLHIEGRGIEAQPTSSMALAHSDGHDALTLRWDVDLMDIGKGAGVKARRFHHGHADVGDTNQIDDAPLVVALAFHLFMRPYMYAASGG